MPHNWIPNSSPDIKKELMRELGINEIQELFNDVPTKIILNKGLSVGFGKPLTEYEVRRLFNELVSKNRLSSIPSFVGGGVCQHYVPSVVKAVLSRPEFYTSYTPYQAEIAQGLLQAIFEYQSLMANLYGVKIVNASMYNGSTASAEAVLMAARVKKKKKILVSDCAHPEIVEVIKSWAFGAGLDIVKVRMDLKSGETDLSDLRSKLDGSTAAVFIQTPNFFGVVESALKEIIEETHKFDALSIVYSNPLSLGVFEGPGNLGADIVVGDVQGLGISLNYGGPSAGILGINDDKELLRQLPGRLIGATRTLSGDELGFTMILQTREQHIKREKATSNITTNSSLEAVGAAVYLTLLGSQGLRKLGEAILGRTHYLIKRLLDTGLAEPLFRDSHYFREVSIKFQGRSADQVVKLLSSRGISIGPALSKFYKELSDCSLVCVTELHARRDIDVLVTVLEDVLRGVQ